MRIEALSGTRARVGAQVTVRMRVDPGRPSAPGGRLWLLWDIRQEAGWLQSDAPSEANFLTARKPCGEPLPATVHSLRTLDLYPEVPEFLGAAEIHVEAKTLGQAGAVEALFPDGQFLIPQWHDR